MQNPIASKIRTTQLIKKNDFKIKKSRGQNFLINNKIVKNIVEILPKKDAGIIEIGAGLGALTEKLIKKFNTVVAIEIDEKLVNILKGELTDKDNGLIVLNEDFLKIDIENLMRSYFSDKEEIYIVSNLPYYITTKIIEKALLEGNKKIKKMVLMLQKEVAEKFAMEENVDSLIGVIIGDIGEIKKHFDVTPKNFYPEPKVNSSIIDIDINSKLDRPFYDFAKKILANKRKVILNSFDKEEKPQIQQALLRLKFNKKTRVTDLNHYQFKELYKETEAVKNENR